MGRPMTVAAKLARFLTDPQTLFALCWGGWAASWMLAARWSSRPLARRRGRAVWLYRGLQLAGLVLIQDAIARLLHVPRLWHVSRDAACVLALLTIPGFSFAWWARLHLGRLWSAAVTLKPDHSVVDTGPYGLVRHPIYTGLLEAMLVSAIASATPLAIVGFAVFCVGIWLKARMEERLLGVELGPDAYAAYRRRVPMFVPGLPM